MARPLAVLIVEDVESDAQLIVRLLTKAGYTIAFERVETPEQMRIALEKKTWEIVISDYSLPELNGPTALKLLQEAGLDLPFIIVSGTMGEETAVEMMKAGAHDYVMKGNLLRLAPAVERELNQAQVRRERKQAEQAMRESEAKFHYFFDHSTIGKSLTLPTGEINANQALCDMLGYTSLDFNNMRWQDITHPDDIELTKREIDQLLSGKRDSTRFIKRYIHKDGSVVWVDLSSSIRRDADGKPLHLMSSIIDITERKQAEEELRQSEARFHQMFEKHDAIMLLIDPQTGLIMDANHSAAKFYGYEKSRLLMMNINDLNTQPPEQVAEERRKALNEERNYFVFTHRMANGTERIVEVHSSPISINEKKVLFSVIHDITERKQAEVVISSYATRLSLSMKAANMAWWEMDINTGHVIFDERKAGMLGYPSEKFQHYNDFMALVHPDDHDPTMNAMKAHLAGTVEKYEVEYRILTKLGEYEWFHDIGAIEKKDSKGAPLTVAGIVINVTARRQAEEELQRQVKELQRWHDVTVGREDRIIGLKKEVNDLLKETDRPCRYAE